MDMRSMRKMLAPMANKLQAVLGKCILSALDDSTAIQLVQLTGVEGETLDKVEHLQPYGFSSSCPPGGQAVAGFFGGSREHGVVLVMAHGATRKKGLAEGEVALYSKHGTHIHLMEDGSIEIETAGTQVQLNGKLLTTDDVEVDTNITAGGDITADGDVADATGTLDALRQDFITFKSTVYNVHNHPTAPVGPVSPPVPVAT